MDNHPKKRNALLQAACSGDMAARNQFAEMNMPLVWSIVKRFSGRGYDPEDLFQIGSIGLIKAIDKFDFSYGVQFSTYAVPVIMGEIRRCLRDDGMVKVSRSVKELAGRLRRAGEVFRQKEGREPTIGELSRAAECTAEEVAVALSAIQPCESLSACVSEGEHREITRMDLLGSEQDMEKETVDKMTVEDMLKKLSERERYIVKKRFFLHRTQTEVAERLGISQVQVSRLEKKIIGKLRAQF